MDKGVKQTCLSIRGAVVERDGREILNIAELDVRQGEFVGIIGANGAGKSTLLKACCGLVPPCRGSVKVCGSEIAGVSGWRKSRVLKNVGYVPQTAEYNPDLPFTTLEVVLMGRTSIRSLASRLRREDREIGEYWLEQLGLADLRNRTFRSLSGGEQQKAMIAGAMASEPKLMLLDEPGANLDFGWKEQLIDILEKVHEMSHVASLFVSHEANLLPGCCGRLILMRDGQVSEDGPVESVLQGESFGSAYGKRVSVSNVAGRWYASACF